MLPISLTLQGVYSYQDKPQTINFGQLTAAEIFGIFGSTGSGKSTILEAISYALFGRTERLTLQDKMKYNMMNLKSKRLFIDFTFAAEEKTYRFTVLAKRHKKNFEEVSTPERQAFIQDGGAWTPIPVESAEEILGLSYENFKRTIIIPQGKFEEFLQMTSTERTRMLKEIFHLEKYELWNRTAALEKKNQLALNAQETLLLQLAEVTPEAMEAVKIQITASEQALTQAQEELRKVRKQAQDLETLKELFDQKKKQEKTWEALHQQEPAFKERAERLARYEACLLHFHPLLERRNELNETLERLTRTRTTKKESANALSVKLQKSEETFGKVKEQYLQREQLRLQAEELEKVIELKASKERLDAIATRIENGQQHVRVTRDKIDNLQLRRQQVSQEIKSIQEQLPDFQVLMEIKTWLGEQAALSKEEARAAESENEAKTRIEALKLRKAEILRPTFLDPSQYALPIAQLLSLFEEEHRLCEGRLRETEQNIARFNARAHLQTLAENLKEGDPCPLCGSTHHPDLQDFAHMEQALETVREQGEQQRRTLRELDNAHAALKALSENYQQRKEEWEQARSRLQAVRKSLEDHSQDFVWEAYRNLEGKQLQSEVERLEKLASSIRSKERDRDVIDQSLGKERENLEKYQKAVDLLKEDRDKQNITFRAGLEGLKTITYDRYVEKDNFQIVQLADQVRRDYEGLTDMYESAESQVRRQRSELDNLKGELEALEEQFQENTQNLARQIRLLNDTLEKSAFENLEEVEAVLRMALNTASERNEINRFGEELHSAQQKLSELEKQTEGKAFDAEGLQALEQEIANRQNSITELTRQLGGQQQELNRLQTQWKQKQELEKEKARLQHRAENLKTMKRLFTKSGFVNYVSTIYLHNLCVAANERFRKLTRGALSLETAEGNQFLVRDFLHDGQTRSVKTLSGGQTFQAALSLALALAERVHQQARSKQNFFFIDEGFGSQDKESLQIIFETLKALRREHRIVGVISHVEELQQEIETFLHITKDPESGSRVRGSWE